MSAATLDSLRALLPEMFLPRCKQQMDDPRSHAVLYCQSNEAHEGPHEYLIFDPPFRPYAC